MPQPVQLDFRALADGIVRQNVGVDGIEVRLRGELQGDAVVIATTGQRLPVTGARSGGGEAPWLSFAVEGFGPDEQVVLRYRGAGDSPAAFDPPSARAAGR